MNRFLNTRGLLACFLLLAFVFLAGCSGAAPGRPGLPLLVIYHTNDIHGYAAADRDENGRLTRLGYAFLKACMNKTAAFAAHTLVVDAGDMLHGQPLATARRGESIARLVSAVGYDALAVGNHEFDYGLARLLELRNKYNLPFVAANVRYKDSGKLVFPPYIVKKLPPVKLSTGDEPGLAIGFFGLSSPQTPQSTTPSNVEALRFSDGEEMARDARAIIRVLKEDEKVDLVVALTHLGTEFSEHTAQWLASAAPGIDYIIDGHSHSEVRNLRVGKTTIASTGAFFRNVGCIEVEMPIDAEGPRGSAELSSAAEWEESIKKPGYFDDLLSAKKRVSGPDPKIKNLIEKMEKELARDMAVVVGRTPAELDGRREHIRTGQTNLGRLITEAMMHYTGAEAALFNSGSIRASIPAGDITRGKLLEVLPYGNYAVTVKLTGAELRKVVRQGRAKPGDGGFLQFAGLDVAPGGAITIGGKPLKDKAEYTVAINDYMNAGGDGYDILKKPPLGEYAPVDEMLLKFLLEKKDGLF